MSSFTLDKFKTNKKSKPQPLPKKDSEDSKVQSDQEFELVEKGKWPLIPVGSYIKWMNENNKITIGGYVLAHRFNQTDKVRKILMCKFFGQTIDRNLNPSWEIKLNQVQRIWKKTPTVYETRVEKIEKDIQSIIKLLGYLNEEIKKLKAQRT